MTTLYKTPLTTLADAIMTTLYKTPLTTLAQAKDFIEALHMAGSLFHFEDSPHDLACFSSEEADDLAQRVVELYSFKWGKYGDPLGYALRGMKFQQ